MTFSGCKFELTLITWSLHCATIVFKALPAYLSGLMKPTELVSSFCLCCPPVCAMHQTGEIRQTLIFFSGLTTIWCFLPPFLQTVTMFNAFKCSLRTYLFKKYLGSSGVLNTQFVFAH